MSGKWYVRRGAKLFGPFATQAIRQGAAKGRLRRTDYLSADGKTWRPAEQYKLAFSNVAARPVLAPSPGIVVEPRYARSSKADSRLPQTPDELSEETSGSAEESRDVEVSFDIEYQGFLRKNPAELTLSAHRLRIDIDDSESLEVERRESAICERLVLRPSRRMSIIVLCVLLGPLGWLLLVVLFALGLKSRLEVDRQRFYLSGDALTAIELWGGSAWSQGRIRRETLGLGLGGIAWGSIQFIAALQDFGTLSSVTHVPGQFSLIFRFAWFEGVVVSILCVAIVLLGFVCILRRDSKALSWDASFFFLLATWNALDFAVLWFVLSAEKGLPKAVKDEMTFVLVLAGFFAVIQIIIGSWMMSLVRQHRKAQRRFSGHDAFLEYVQDEYE